jgi:hypothetical protein
MDIAALATAFSTHQFEKALPHIHDDVTWHLVGNETVTGKHIVEKLVGLTADALKNTTVTVRESRTIVGADTIVVDTVTHYDDPADGVSIVASCDLYDHADGVITKIRSYTVELPE